MFRTVLKKFIDSLITIIVWILVCILLICLRRDKDGQNKIGNDSKGSISGDNKIFSKYA